MKVKKEEKRKRKGKMNQKKKIFVIKFPKRSGKYKCGESKSRIFKKERLTYDQITFKTLKKYTFFSIYISLVENKY